MKATPTVPTVAEATFYPTQSATPKESVTINTREQLQAIYPTNPTHLSDTVDALVNSKFDTALLNKALADIGTLDSSGGDSKFLLKQLDKLACFLANKGKDEQKSYYTLWVNNLRQKLEVSEGNSEVSDMNPWGNALFDQL